MMLTLSYLIHGSKEKFVPTNVPTSGCQLLEPVGFSSRGEIDRAGEKFVQDKNDLEATRIIKSYREFRINCLHTSLSILQKAGLPEHCIVSARLKRMQSIYRKLIRSQQPQGLGNMDDIIGFRVICESYKSARELIDRISSLPEHLKSRLYLDKEHYLKTGYRASHHIMKFAQPKDQNNMMSVRFEIQVRTYYQHRWAVWCESYGDQAKEGFIGRADNMAKSLRQTFMGVSQHLVAWEETNPSDIQTVLPKYAGKLNLVVAWHPEGMLPHHLIFYEDVKTTVDFLDYLETQYSQEVKDILMLVGVSDNENLIDLLKKTHPRFVSSQFDLAPENWMPVSEEKLGSPSI